MNDDVPDITEAPDRAKKKARQKTKREKHFEEERKKLQADEDIESAVAQSSVQKKREALHKRRIKQGIGGFAGLLFIWLLIWLFSSVQGTMGFGICRVFLEQTVQYPTSLRLNQVEEFSNWTRIWFTQTDSYGQYRLEPIQCYWRKDEQLGYTVLEKVTIRRRELEPEIIAAFNKSIPVIMENPPDLTLPPRLPDNLRNLHFEVNRFIKPIL